MSTVRLYSWGKTFSFKFGRGAYLSVIDKKRISKRVGSI